MIKLFFFQKNFHHKLAKREREIYGQLQKKLVIPHGQPFFLSSNGLPDQELNGFCSYLLSPRRASPRTWASYAIQVAIYIRYLESQGKDWKAAKRNDIKSYFIVRTTGEFQNKAPIKTRSWNIAATAIVHLYEYAQDNLLISELPFRYRAVKSKLGGFINAADITAKFTPNELNFISIDDYKCKWRPTLAGEKNSQRNLALTDLLISSGIRISEALNLKIYQIPDPDDEKYYGRKTVPIKVVGKGNKGRTVRVPKKCVRAINFYIEEERIESVHKPHESTAKSKNTSDHVFLSVNGSPLSARAIEFLFARISKLAGIKITPHGCRHTFAVYQLEAMIKRMAMNLKELKSGGADAYRQILNDPLRELQLLLGHKQIASTYIYLDFLEDAEALVDESLSDWMRWGNEIGK
jgi:integrase/recombinase XerC